MKKKLVLIIALALLFAATGSVVYWARSVRHLEKTDNAYVKADNVIISSKISGYVAEVSVQANQRVQVGQVLLRIEPSDYQAKVEQEQAALQSHQAALLTLERQKEFQRSQIAAAEAMLKAAITQTAKSIRDYQRDRELIVDGYATREQADNSRAAADVASANEARLRAEVAAARGQLAIMEARGIQLNADVQRSAAAARSVQLDLTRATLVAPISGAIGNKTVEVGQFVKAGTQLMTVVPTDHLYVVANFKETQLRSLRRGQPAIFTVDAFPGIEFTGEIDSIAPATGSEFSLLPPENAVGNFTKIVQRVPVKIALAKTDQSAALIRPGMSVAVTVDTRSLGPAPSLAQTSQVGLR